MTPDGFCATSALRTVIDCCRTGTLYEAVAIADSALNQGKVTRLQLNDAAARCRGPGSGKAQKAVRLADGRADSAQESVARLALASAGMPAQPQFRLGDDPESHAFDLGIAWARLVIDLQSKAYHAEWEKVQKDVGHLKTVNLTGNWRLAQSLPWMVLPSPEPFVSYVLGVVVGQPGQRCENLRRKYVDVDGLLTWPNIANPARRH